MTVTATEVMHTISIMKQKAHCSASGACSRCDNILITGHRDLLIVVTFVRKIFISISL